MVSASHNPFADNGIKLLDRGGRKLADAVEASIEGGASARSLGDRADPVGPTGAASGVRRDRRRAPPTTTSSTSSPRSAERPPRRLRVVVDCANGAASAIAPDVLASLGRRVDGRSVPSPDGCNINEGCGSTDAQPVADGVVAAGADLGVAFDGDADRLHRGGRPVASSTATG